MKRKFIFAITFGILYCLLLSANVFALPDSDMEIRVASPLDSLASESGVVAVEKFPAEIAVKVTAKTGALTGVWLEHGGQNREIAPEYMLTIEGKEACGPYTLTAKTDQGAVLTVTANVVFLARATHDVRYRTIGMDVSEVYGGKNLITSFPAPQRVELVDANTIAGYEQERIAGWIDKYDGGTYTLKGSLVVEVYSLATGKVYGTYNANEDYENLTRGYSWTPQTLIAFATMLNTALSYQAPVRLDIDAAWCDEKKQEVYGKLSAQDKGAPEYLFPYKTSSVFFSKDDIQLPGFIYKGLEWKYSPNTVEYTDGESPNQTSITQKINYKIPVSNFYFKFSEQHDPVGDNPKEGKPGDDIPDTNPDPDPDEPGPEDDTPADEVEAYDLDVQRITPDRYKENQTVVSTIKVSNKGDLDYTPGQNVTVLFEAPELSLKKRVDAVVMEQDTWNVVAVKWNTPNVRADKSITLIALINPDHTLENETSAANNTYTQNAVVKNVAYDEPEESITVPEPPPRSGQNRVTWREQRYENGQFVWREFYAELNVTAVLDYDTKAKGFLKSGYGFSISVTAAVNTNYDKPELITLPQTVEVYLPQYCYETAIPLMKDGGTFTFMENPDSPFRYKKQYVPVWFPDNTDYIVQLLVTDAHTPGGTLSQWITGGVLEIYINDSMYSDDVTTGN